jgi:hypothetical protein
MENEMVDLDINEMIKREQELIKEAQKRREDQDERHRRQAEARKEERNQADINRKDAADKLAIRFQQEQALRDRVRMNDKQFKAYQDERHKRHEKAHDNYRQDLLNDQNKQIKEENAERQERQHRERELAKQNEKQQKRFESMYGDHYSEAKRGDSEQFKGSNHNDMWANAAAIARQRDTAHANSQASLDKKIDEIKDNKDEQIKKDFLEAKKAYQDKAYSSEVMESVASKESLMRGESDDYKRYKEASENKEEEAKELKHIVRERELNYIGDCLAKNKKPDEDIVSKDMFEQYEKMKKSADKQKADGAKSDKPVENKATNDNGGGREKESFSEAHQKSEKAKNVIKLNKRTDQDRHAMAA